LKNRAASASGLFVSFVIAVGFALIPASIISFIISERENNLKHMQLISGMSLSSYWISNYIFDILKAEITMGIAIGLFYAFGVNVTSILS
jgi:ATP-binding cassette subfamily A (ABC1) protein 3